MLSFAAAPLVVAGAAGSQARSARKHLSVSTALLIMHTSNWNIHKKWTNKTLPQNKYCNKQVYFSDDGTSDNAPQGQQYEFNGLLGDGTHIKYPFDILSLSPVL